MLACFAPLSAFAQDDTSIEPAPVLETQAEPTETLQQPVAPEVSSNPVVETPPQETFTYDAETERWSSDKWQYDPSSNTYVPAVPPSATTLQTVPATDSTASGAGESADSTAKSTSNSSTTSSIINALDSMATTGAAGVLANGQASNALTGDAASIATIINNVNSTVSNANNNEVATFVSDIMGDVNGDILLQPMLLKAMLEANAQKQSAALQVQNGTSIVNDINLGAESGAATIDSNTSAGDATSGSANTVADVVNIVNSMVASDQSFIGTVNIYGNLNGDILIAPDFIPQLIANNGVVGDEYAATKVNASDTQSIINNVALAAESGTALVTNNTAAGNAQSGDADTNLVIFNLSGHEIVASNSLLVFVNVLGKWVGVIVDAPIGATAAAIADGVTTNNRAPSTLAIDVVNEASLTNNIMLNSKSGDAKVSNNTLAGNATTGSATASANIANISNSQLGLSGWFGVLFINVFGTWLGSFGIDTAAGNAAARAESSATTTGNIGEEPVRVMTFIPHTSSPTARVQNHLTVVDPSADAEALLPVTNVKSASANTERPESLSRSVASDIPTQQDYIDARNVNYPLAFMSLVVVGVSIYGLRRFLF